MTLKLALSQVKALPFNFETGVKEHIAALVTHQKTTGGEAAPTAPPLVELAVKRIQHAVTDEKPDTFEADYEIIDDTPSLDERRAALARETAAVAEMAARMFSPPLRRRLADLELTAALSTDAESRTDAQKTVIARAKEVSDKHAKINWALAHAEAEIHELTEETIGAWKIPDFSA